jgi:photosystem II stability/assembly factor-like uncharacterized protein
MIFFLQVLEKRCFKSTDFGQSWQSLSDELPSKWVNDIKTDGTNIFVALSGNGVYCSSDNGVTWQPKNNGIEESYPGMILIDGENLFQIDDYEIYFSDDYGETWFKTLDAPEFVNDIIRSEDKILAGNADGIYEYIFETNSWVLMADDSEMLYISDLHYDNGIIYAGTYSQGIYYSSDGGTEWQMLGEAELKYDIREIYIIDNQLCAFTHSGIFITNDKGNTWMNKNAGLHNTIVRSILFKDDEIFTNADKRVFKFNKAKGEWVQTNIGFELINIYKLYAHGDDLYALCSNTILKSTDNGNSWEYKSDGLPVETVFVNIFAIGNDLFVGTYDGLYVSENDAESWKLVSGDSPAGRSFAVYEYNGVIYSGAWEGFFISYDKGVTWEQVNDVQSIITAVLVLDDFIIISAYRDILISNDGGETWKVIENVFNNVVFEFLDYEEYLFAATANGLYFSRDNGESWEFIGADLNSLSIYDVEIEDDFIYVCTDGGGIYMAPVSEFVPASIAEHDLNDIIIYPNPAEDYIEITLSNYSVNKGLQPIVQDDDIAIYDVLGARVFSTEDTERSRSADLSNGGHFDYAQSPFRIDISHLPRGVYFVRFGDKVEKFVKN